MTSSQVHQQTTLLVFVTGLSGAGRSTAVAALEDLGYFCIDNLPSPVVAATLGTLAAYGVGRIALGIDVRVGAFFDQAVGVVDEARKLPNSDVSVLFLDASDEALLRRFSSTRRPHPLSTPNPSDATVEATAVLDGINFERARLAGLRDRATTIVDTTSLNVHDLRRLIVNMFGPGVGNLPKMRIRVVSFGFKYGTPIDADLVFDVRFMKNPFFVESLRHQTGLDEAVLRYVLDDADGREFVDRIDGLLEFCLPRFEREGRSYLTVAVGCTGGQHRSVAVANEIATRLRHRCAFQPGSAMPLDALPDSARVHELPDRAECRYVIDVVHRDAERNRLSDRPIALSPVREAP